MNARLFHQMMAFFRLPAGDVVKLLHAGEYQQLKFRAVVRDKARRRERGTIVGYAAPQLVLAVALAVASMFGGACATAPRALDVEAVGQLSPSDTHVAQAAVHATTDLSPGGFVAADADAGDDRGMVVEAAETPDVAVKGGLTMGGAR